MEAALKDTVGTAAGGVTVSAALALPIPPAPEQDSENVVELAIPLTVCVPEVACVPLQPPLAEQLVALVELQVKVTEPPALMLD
jgi:hypothetical protein